MEAKELMIGDYVNYRGQIIKVTSLYDKGGSNEVGWSDKESVWVNASNVEPIPLTEEILERNGFVRCSGKGYQLNQLSTFRLQTSTSKDESTTTFWIRIADIWVHIMYVHQLQRVLRTCGIGDGFTLQKEKH